jgi:disulfide bond formation protein DsbB
MMLQYVGHSALAWLTLFGQVVLGLFLLLSFFGRRTALFKQMLKIAGSRAVLFSFIIVLVAMVGSLYYSDILGFEPCRLCWYQRILMYPQVLLFGVALLKRKNDVFQYVLPLAIIGAVLAGYHYGIQMMHLATPGFSDSCSATGVSCVSTEFLELGYITIPLMAFTAFALVLAMALIKILKQK